MSDFQFAVLDLETTGFSPKKGDRIVELSIVTLNKKGEIEDEYETLVNPNRDVGNAQVHGVTAEMVKDAPTIEDIHETVVSYLNKGVPIAHNASFDLRFLNHELKRLDESINDISGLCTLNLSKQIVPDLPSHKLEKLCDFFDIQLSNAHSAYADCLATAHLFKKLQNEFLNKRGSKEFEKQFIQSCLFEDPKYPLQPRQKVAYRRPDASGKKEAEPIPLRTMLSRLPENKIAAGSKEEEYLTLLDESMADRIITNNEIDQLFALAQEQGITREEASNLHKRYFKELVRVYLEDAYLSDPELKDLDTAGRLLGIEQNEQEQIMEDEKSDLSKAGFSNTSIGREEVANKSVCFTGEFYSKLNGEPISRKAAQELAMERGMIIKSGVSKKLDYLVTADPHSQSGKAEKARQAGVKIVAEPVFWQMLGINVD